MSRMIIRIILFEVSSKFWTFSFNILMSTDGKKSFWVVINIKSNHIMKIWLRLSLIIGSDVSGLLGYSIHWPIPPNAISLNNQETCQNCKKFHRPIGSSQNVTNFEIFSKKSFIAELFWINFRIWVRNWVWSSNTYIIILTLESVLIGPLIATLS